jgi:hypothetical protein
MGNISNARISAAIFLRVEKERQRMAEGHARENCLKGHPITSVGNSDSQISFYIYVLTGEDSGFADAYCKRCNEIVRYRLDKDTTADMKKARIMACGGSIKREHGENLDVVDWLESNDFYNWLTAVQIERLTKKPALTYCMNEKN